MTWRSTLTTAVASTLLGATLFAPPAPATATETLRGAIVSCPGWGRIWGSPAMAESLDEIATLGANAVAIHPYGWIKRDGRVEFQSAATLDFLKRAVEYTRERDLELFWKPHLGYWGQFPWRGDIEFGDDAEAWQRFFADYEAFIVDQAIFAEAHGIPRFAVGVELEGTTHREREWRRIIDRVRAVYSGRILYASNWSTLDQVPFWDAMDIIGVHGYFPLSEKADPDRDTLVAGWNAPLATLRTLSERHNKPVLLAEIGYNVSSKAASEPWSYRVEDSPENRRLRDRLMDVAIERIEAESFIEGMFWWKWMPGPSHWRRNFSVRDPGASAVLKSRWGQGEPPSAEADKRLAPGRL